MTGTAMKAWRKSLGFSRKGAAEALGISESQIVDYETGMKRGTGRPAQIPKAVALACAAITAGIMAE
jgi:predicted transcriptional regulator